MVLNDLLPVFIKLISNLAILNRPAQYVINPGDWTTKFLNLSFGGQKVGGVAQIKFSGFTLGFRQGGMRMNA